MFQTLAWWVSVAQQGKIWRADRWHRCPPTWWFELWYQYQYMWSHTDEYFWWHLIKLFPKGFTISTLMFKWGPLLVQTIKGHNPFRDAGLYTCWFWGWNIKRELQLLSSKLSSLVRIQYMVILNLDSELSEKSANFHKIVCCKTLLISKRNRK